MNSIDIINIWLKKVMNILMNTLFIINIKRSEKSIYFTFAVKLARSTFFIVCAMYFYLIRYFRPDVAHSTVCFC